MWLISRKTTKPAPGKTESEPVKAPTAATPAELPPAAAEVKKPVPGAHRNVQPQRIHENSNNEANLTHAQETRNLLERGEGFGMLSTLHSETKGPFGSVINYALDNKGTILFFASQLAEHYQNIMVDDRVSLLVVDETKTPGGDRLSLSRATVMGRASVVPKTDEVYEVLFKRHPSSSKYGKWDDFVVIGITVVENIRYIKGFGEMSWIKGDEFTSTEFDPVVVSSGYAVEHMNKDHADHLLKIVNALSHRSDFAEAVVLRFDRKGMDCLCKTSIDGRPTPVRIAFTEPVNEASELRVKMKDMMKQAEKILSTRTPAPVADEGESKSPAPVADEGESKSPAPVADEGESKSPAPVADEGESKSPQ